MRLEAFCNTEGIENQVLKSLKRCSVLSVNALLNWIQSIQRYENKGN